MIIKLGNLGVKDIERDLGIKFSEEDFEFLEETHQTQVSKGLEDVKFPKDSWHFFDKPRELVLGSFEFFNKFQNILNKYELNGFVKVSFETAEDETIESRFTLKTSDGIPRFLATHHIFGNFSTLQFFQLRKINKKTLVYTRVPSVRFFKDVLKISNFIINDVRVPEEQNNLKGTLGDLKINKEQVLNPMDNIVFTEEFKGENSIDIVKIWNGEEFPILDEKFNLPLAKDVHKKFTIHKRNMNKK